MALRAASENRLTVEPAYRPRMRPLLALVALGLLLVAPAASACSLVNPGPFVRVAWEDGDDLITNRAFDVGRFHLASATFSQLASTPYQAERQAVLSPDGRWLVYSHSEGLGADCSSSWSATYALEVAKGTKTKLRDAALAVLSTPTGPVLADDGGTRLERYAWGAWASPVALPRPSQGAIHVLAVAGSSLLAAWERDRGLVHFIDAAEARLLGSVPVHDGLLGAAESPDGRYVALATGDSSGASAGHDLRIYERKEEGLTAKVGWHAAKPLRQEQPPRSLDWGPRGIVLPLSGALWWIERPLEGGPVVSIATDAELKSPSWASDGDRVALGQGQGLRLFDLNKRTETRYTAEGSGFVKSTPSLRPTALASDTYRAAPVPPAVTGTGFAAEGTSSLPGPSFLLALGLVAAAAVTRSRSR